MRKKEKRAGVVILKMAYKLMALDRFTGVHISPESENIQSEFIPLFHYTIKRK